MTRGNPSSERSVDDLRPPKPRLSRVEISEDPSLSEIVEAIRRHHDEFPSHGIACVCTDDVIRTVREAMTVGTLRERLDDGDLWKLQSRIDYVLLVASRRDR